MECPLAEPDLETALRGRLSAEPAVKAIQTGESCVREAVTTAIGPFKLSSGGYRLEKHVPVSDLDRVGVPVSRAVQTRSRAGSAYQAAGRSGMAPASPGPSCAVRRPRRPPAHAYHRAVSSKPVRELNRSVTNRWHAISECSALPVSTSPPPSFSARRESEASSDTLRCSLDSGKKTRPQASTAKRESCYTKRGSRGRPPLRSMPPSGDRT